MKFLLLLLFLISNCVQMDGIKQIKNKDSLAGLIINKNISFKSSSPEIETVNNPIAISENQLELITINYPTKYLFLTRNRELPSALMIPIVNKLNITYEILPNLPNGLTLSSTGEISGTPTINSNLSQYKITVRGNNSIGEYILFISINNQYNYIDYGETILQQETNLRWTKCTIGQNGNACVGSSPMYNRLQAINICDSLNLLQKKWRLPRLDELLSLVVVDQTPKLNNNFFINSYNYRYWTISTFNQSINKFIYVNFSTGFIENGGELQSNYVRCVSEN